MIKQLKVELDNKPGTLKHCVSFLAESGIDIKALEVTERGAGGHGEVHLIVSKLELALDALKKAGFKYQVEEVLAVEMDDRVGGLAAILGRLADQQINIRYLYAFISRVEGKSLAVFSVKDPAAAQRVLEEAHFPIVSQMEIEGGDADKYKFKASIEDHFGKDFIW